MADEKKKEKVTPEAAEDQMSDVSNAQEEPISETKSEPSQDVVKSLQGQISKLQRELNESRQKLEESSEFSQRIVKALSDEEEVPQEVTPDMALSEVEKLRQEIKQKEAELAKNEYIDSLTDVPEAQKTYLKKKVGVVEDLKGAVANELEALNQVIQASTVRATDRRPTKVGNANIDITDARQVLDNPEAFK